MSNGYIINRGGESDPQSLKLYTRLNRFVRNETCSGAPPRADEGSNADLAAAAPEGEASCGGFNLQLHGSSR
jgi:hypothetical protein